MTDQTHTPTRQSRQSRTHSSLLLIAAFCSLSAWGQDTPKDGVYTDRIDWGVLMDMSGPTSASQGVWVNGFRDYMRKINEAGGINGRKINVLAEDNRFNPATDKIAFEKLVSQTPVIAISGMGSSVSQVALAPTIKAGKVPIVGTYTATKALSEPVTPMVYNGFCGYKQMAQAGVGYHVDKLKLKSPKVVTLAIETAGGKEYHDYVTDAASKFRGSATHLTVKVTAVDMTPQILEIMKINPDFITVYGVSNTAILLMKGLAQYGLKIPTFGITYLGAPQMFQSMGGDAAANYKFISCFTPGGADQTPGNKALSQYADTIGRDEMKQDINYVAGWITGQMAAEALSKLEKGVFTTPKARKEERAAQTAAMQMLSFLGMEDIAQSLPSELSYGRQKQVEFARALMQKSELVLLDEPMAGMSTTEKAAMSALIQKVRQSMGISFLIVEHDIPVVMDLSDKIVVLDFGQKIAEGQAQDIQNDPAVIVAYLGSGH